MDAIDDDDEELLPMETAPKDGTVIRLFYPEGRVNVRRGLPGRRKRVYLPDLIRVGKWWTAKDAPRKGADPARRHLIERDGGYWAGVKKSEPFKGDPDGWLPMRPEELHWKSGGTWSPTGPREPYTGKRLDKAPSPLPGPATDGGR